MSTTRSSADTIRDFFSAFGKGDQEGLIACFSPESEIHAVRAGQRTGVYGTYRGKTGAKEFASALGAAFDTKAFTVDSVVGEGEVAFANGSFVHELRATGRNFESAWALRCVVRSGHIDEFRFYEDSAAFEAAARPRG